MKEIEEFMKESAFFNDFSKLEKDIVKNLVKKYSENLVDYISDNIDADYTKILDSTREKYDPRDADMMEVYVPKGQFEEFKKIIK